MPGPEGWQAPSWQQRSWRHKLGRRLFHLVVGSVFPVLAFFLAWETLLAAVAGTTVVALTLEIVRLRWGRLNRAFFRHLPLALKQAEASKFTGATYLLVGSTLTFTFFDRPVAIAALLFLSVGDAMAGTVGERFGRRRFWGRSLEGSFAYVASGAVVAAVLWGVGLELSLPVMMVGAVAAAAFELAPLPLDDNLVTPLFSSGIMVVARFAGF